jgi:hypothetical protein
MRKFLYKSILPPFLAVLDFDWYYNFQCRTFYTKVYIHYQLIHSSWIFDRQITHFYKIQQNIEDYTNLIIITSLTCSTLLICRGDVGDLRNDMSWWRGRSEQTLGTDHLTWRGVGGYGFCFDHNFFFGQHKS